MEPTVTKQTSHLATRSATPLALLIALPCASLAVAGCQPKPLPIASPPAAEPAPIDEPDALPPFVSSEAQLEISDDQLATAVRRHLLLDDAVPSYRLTVNAVDGIVTLEGTVDNVLAAKRAVELAEHTKGTRSVVSEITVAPVARGDEEIANDVRQALLYDPAADSYQIEVVVKNGEATMTGVVDSYAEKHIAEHVVSGVRGVRDVHDEVTVSYQHERTDDQILQDIRRRLEIDALVDDLLISPVVKDAHVTLQGTVGSAAERRRAIWDAWVAGVRSVDATGLEVEWWARDRFRRDTAPQDLSDTEIAAAVREAFLYDPRVDSYELGVHVADGTAVLTGTVEDVAAKRAAEADAKNTVGVSWVRDYIEVRPNEIPTDSKLEERVRRALDWDPWISDEDIVVSVERGTVSLYGVVDTSMEKHRAEEVASRVKGVVRVQNEVAVERRPTSDAELRKAVEDALVWNPFVVAANVTVEIAKGTVMLSGTVANWRAYREAAKAAYEAGAQQVVNSLVVRGSEQ